MADLRNTSSTALELSPQFFRAIHSIRSGSMPLSDAFVNRNSARCSLRKEVGQFWRAWPILGIEATEPEALDPNLTSSIDGIPRKSQAMMQGSTPLGYAVPSRSVVNVRRLGRIVISLALLLRYILPSCPSTLHSLRTSKSGQYLPRCRMSDNLTAPRS